ncbi:MAG TPA: hypothetical protein VK308_06355 [Pyrinomonadaceae bacterium]|nr:hypothetical protein [Pyrinomonadaceae bacterium]
MEKKQPDEWLKDLPVQTENVAYQPEEMIRCEKCERTNPPTRLKCFYCGAELLITEARNQFLKPNLRKLETWEKGFNVILSPNAQISDETKLITAAKLLKLEKEAAADLMKADTPLPLARAESKKEAEIVQSRLGEIGIETIIVSDEALAIDKPPRRLRGIEFFDDKLILILFNQNELIEMAFEDLVLIVTGAVYERKIEATEKYNKKGENKILNAVETASDETLIDIYSRADSLGFRIYAKGFDFSSLEAEKEMLAKDNIKKLADKLRQVAPNAKYTDNYLSNRSRLMNVWEVEQKTDSQGLKRESFGRFNLGNVTTVKNLSQFTKYSRLQWQLL